MTQLSPADCARLARQPNPNPAALAGCPMGQGGVFIDGGEGDDRVIIHGRDHHVQVVGGPGRDTVSIDDAAGQTISTLGLTGVVALGGGAIIAALMATLVCRALMPRRRG